MEVDLLEEVGTMAPAAAKSSQATDAMFPSLQSVVPAAAAGQELLAWLTATFRYLDAAGWTAAIERGAVFRNGAHAGAQQVLQPGDTVGFVPDAEPPAAAVEVLHLDDDVIAVEKPAHFVMQQHTAFPRWSLARAVAHAVGHQDSPPTSWPEPAHRLDRQTSGVVVWSRHPAAARALQRCFAARQVHKEYIAIIRGVLPADQIEVEAPIGRAAGSAIAARHAVVAATARGARAARSTFRVLVRLATATVVQAVPHTGRTHQLRVHLEHLGHPLVGDVLYGRSDAHYLAYVAACKAGAGPDLSSRHLLHAARLVLPHPRTGSELRLQAPWPADLRELVAADPAGRAWLSAAAAP
jgi:23S rRNA pseudouridine1911/1915/1917 synthase